MAQVNNFEIIKPLLTFEDENDFYFLQILQRKKDHPEGTVVGSNNSSRLIKSYNIFSIEQLEKYKKEIIMCCELFEARAMIGVNRRNSKKMSLEMMLLLATNIKSNHYNQLSNLWNIICGQYHHETDKKWIVDLDYINPEEGLKLVSEVSNYIFHQMPLGSKVKHIIPSKNGCHLIVSPFDTRTFSKDYSNLDLHKNNPTNLFIP